MSRKSFDALGRAHERVQINSVLRHRNRLHRHENGRVQNNRNLHQIHVQNDEQLGEVLDEHHNNNNNGENDEMDENNRNPGVVHVMNVANDIRNDGQLREVHYEVENNNSDDEDDGMDQNIETQEL